MDDVAGKRRSLIVAPGESKGSASEWRPLPLLFQSCLCSLLLSRCSVFDLLVWGTGSAGIGQGCGVGVGLLVRSLRAGIGLTEEDYSWLEIVGIASGSTLTRRSGSFSLDQFSSIPRRWLQKGRFEEGKGDCVLLGSFYPDLDQKRVFVEMRRRRCCKARDGYSEKRFQS